MKYRLDELFDLQMGKTPARKNPEYWNVDENKWISIADLSKCGKYINATKESISNKAVSESGIMQIPKNTVIMSFKLSIGKTAITSEPMYSNEAIISFRDKHVVEIMPEYLYYLILSKDWNAGTNKAVMGKTLNKATLSKVTVNIHNIVQQHKIVETLDKVNNVVMSRQQQLKKLDELVKSRFIELFGEPDGNPMNWETAELERNLEIVGGFAFKSEGFTESGIPVLRIGNINSGHFLPVNMVFWPDDPSLARYKMYPGDLVMSLTGTVGKDDYGNVCVLSDEYPEYYLNQRNAKLAIGATLNRHYLSEMLKFSRIKKRLTGISRGVRQANISNRDILALRVPIPPIKLQEQFATFVEQTDKSKLAIQQSLEKLETLKKALMQQYFG